MTVIHIEVRTAVLLTIRCDMLHYHKLSKTIVYILQALQITFITQTGCFKVSVRLVQKLLEKRVLCQLRNHYLTAVMVFVWHRWLFISVLLIFFTLLLSSVTELSLSEPPPCKPSSCRNPWCLHQITHRNSSTDSGSFLRFHLRLRKHELFRGSHLFSDFLMFPHFCPMWRRWSAWQLHFLIRAS